MPKYHRTEGCEQNSKSGTIWNEEELSHVLNLYLTLQKEAKDGEPKIHVHNIDIQILGETLGRTTRSVESQMLMFRCLDRHKKYSRKNMSNLCIKLWNEHIEKLIEV